MDSQTHEPTVDDLQVENQRLRDELHRCQAQLTAIRAVVTGAGAS